MSVPLRAKKTVMYILQNQPEHLRGAKEAFQLKNEAESLLEQVIRHCTMTSATLIGLIALLLDPPESGGTLRLLLVWSTVLLSLCVLLGVIYSFLYFYTRHGLAARYYQAVQDGENIAENSSMILPLIAKIYPIAMVLGVFCLSASVLYILW